MPGHHKIVEEAPGSTHAILDNSQFYWSVKKPSYGYHQLKNSATGLCMNVYGNSNRVGVLVTADTCTGYYNQQWLTKNYGVLQNRHSGLCLAISNYNLGSYLIQNNCSDNFVPSIAWGVGGS